jgi:glyoxylase-like metal-dependent hydrolase (beta-lactamase superfamily II)
MMSTLLRITAFLAALGFAGAAGQGQNFDNVEVETRPVQGNVHMLVGAGGNITVQTGNDGVLVVDTQFAPMAPKLLAAIRKLSDKPIRYIINTHVHGDHSGGNESLARADGATIIGHANILKVMSAPKDGSTDDRFRQPKGAWPAETFTDRRTLRFNGEDIELIHIPTAHSTGDTLVHFKGSGVISGGDIFAITRYPVFDFDGGGRISGMIEGLNRIAAAAGPTPQSRTYVVPGHGRLCDREDVVKYRDMTLVLRDRIQALVRKGLTLEQVKSAKPTRDYDPLYGASSGLAATDSFVEDVYQSLTAR